MKSKKYIFIKPRKNRKVKVAIMGTILTVIVGGSAVYLQPWRTQEKTQTQSNRVSYKKVNKVNTEISQPKENQSGLISYKSTTSSSIKMTLEEVNPDEIVLVNKSHPLSSEYKVELKWLASRREQVASEIYKPLEEMLSDGSSEGKSFIVASGYRSEDYQQQIWEDTIKMWKRQGMSEEEAVNEASKTLAYPGESEHATGLAIDIVSEEYQLLDEGQHNTKESTWLRENCYKYGFILRYPKGKEEVTGISYESWHYRYVGKAVAKCIMEHGITLEEYLDYALNEK